jgi:predicted nucleotidyltransferase
MSKILEYRDPQRHLFFTNYQKILKYLADRPSGEHTEKEVREATSISRAGVNFALRALVKDGLVRLQKRGKMSFYSVSLDNPLIRQIKVVINLLKIDSLVSTLKGLTERIILFGSSATGTNIEESDIDLFILTNNPKEVLKKVSAHPLTEKIQLVAKKPIDFMSLKKKAPVFYDEVSRGLLVWEKKNEQRI